MNSDEALAMAGTKMLSSSLMLGFKFLAWLNGLGVALVLVCSAGIIEVGLDPTWLRMPLAGFLAGLSLVTLGLLWVYPVQASLLSQLIAARPRRTHWLPLACVLIAYTLSLLAFVVSSWVTQGMLAF